MEVWPGRPYPLGATYDGLGTNFSVFSEVATRVELCLFDEAGNQTSIDLKEVTGFCWHGYLPQAGPGQRYGYRIHGPWKPEEGLRCNPAKLLIDPYAKAVEGAVSWGQPVFPYKLSAPDGPPDASDSAPFVPKSVVINPYFAWGDGHVHRRPLNETVIYETHVKGFTIRHPDIPQRLRGTYAGLAHPAAISHLKKLGVTAVELMPVHQFVHDDGLLRRGLRNYWGYNSIAFLAPHNEYSGSGQLGQQVQEFKHMVRALHEADMEVILDVVYNHTAEGNHLGPMLSFKGVDNAAYYHLVEKDRRYYMDYTGTGNSLNMRHPHVLQLLMDSLRYWAIDMRVDGFRFDLASTLARELHEVDRLSAFFDLIQQDPVISQLKLIAEPWDVGDGGYQVGNFPPLWSEWNGKYRDCIRDFWRSQDKKLSEFAGRITGSSDLYENTGRRPFASVNFVTAHDGFTLRDLVSYNQKHNEANGDENRDGPDDNRSWNCGAEGPSEDRGVLALRARQMRNMLTTLLLSQGVPLLLGGDEMGRTQHGNNNGYCQDNETSWYDWFAVDNEMLEFTRRLINFRHEHLVFRRCRWFTGTPVTGTEQHEIAWFNPCGRPMSEGDWKEGFAKSLAVYLNGQSIPCPDPYGHEVSDDTFCVLFNAHYEAIDFHMPPEEWAAHWELVMDTATGWAEEGSCARLAACEKFRAIERSMAILRRVD